MYAKSGIIIKAIKTAETHLDIRNPEEWNRVSRDQLREIGVGKIFYHNGGISKTLQIVYPDLKL